MLGPENWNSVGVGQWKQWQFVKIAKKNKVHRWRSCPSPPRPIKKDVISALYFQYCQITTPQCRQLWGFWSVSSLSTIHLCNHPSIQPTFPSQVHFGQKLHITMCRSKSLSVLPNRNWEATTPPRLNPISLSPNLCRSPSALCASSVW